MSPLRTIIRTSNWTPDRLRVLSAIVVSADHVSDAPLGRVDGVVLDERGEVQSFIVTLWDEGHASHAVLLPLAGVVWYTEGFAPALGIAWAPEVLRRQPVLAGSSRPRRPSLVGAELAIVIPDAVDVAPRRKSRGTALVGLLGAAGTATLGALLLDPMLVASIALFLAPIAAALGTRRVRVAPAVVQPLLPEREPWVTDLEKHLLAPSTFERRVLHFSLLRPIAPARATVAVALPAIALPAVALPAIALPAVVMPVAGAALPVVMPVAGVALPVVIPVAVAALPVVMPVAVAALPVVLIPVAALPVVLIPVAALPVVLVPAAILAGPPIVPAVHLFAAPRPISRTKWLAARVTSSPEGI